MRLFIISIIVLFGSAIFGQNFEWTSQNSGVTVKLNDVYFTDNQTGWAVGDDGVIINTTDGGQTWMSQASGTTEKLRAVFFVDNNTGWAVGGTLSKTMLKTTDGGANWQSLDPNIFSNLMYDIAFYDANTGWVITKDSIYMTTDGGTTWINEVYSASVVFPNAKVLAVTSDTTAYVAGSMFRSVSSRQAAVFYRDTEATPIAWSISPFNNSTTDDEIISMSFTASKIGFAGGLKGKLYKKSGPQGLDPWDLNLDLSASGVTLISSISFPNDNDGMFCFSKNISGTNYAYIYHTSNSGDTWSAVPDSIEDVLSPVLFASDSVNTWLVGVGGKIYKGTREPSAIGQRSLDIEVNIYPNPATDRINIVLTAKSNELVNYSLSDLTGRIIEKGQWNLNSSNARFTLSLSDVVKGMYLLKLSTDEGQSSFRVLKN